MQYNITSRDTAGEAALVAARPGAALATDDSDPQELPGLRNGRLSIDAARMLPPLDTSDLRSNRVTGTKRLALVAGEQRLSTATIEAVMAAAADPRRDFTARNTAGFDQVVELATVVNGWEWTFRVVVDPRVRWECFKDMLRRADRMAAAHFPRLHPHDRTGAIDRLALDLITDLRPLEDTSIRMSNWDAWYVWCCLLPLRMFSAAGERNRNQRLVFVSLDEIPAFGESPDRNPVALGVRDPDPDEMHCVQLAWHIASHLLDERTPELLATCRAGDQLRRMATVCEAALWVLRQGADDPDQRTMFTEDAVSAKLLAWRGLAAARPDSWGRYGAHAVPTRQVIERIAGTVDRAGCECAVSRTGKPRRCWFHSVSSRVKDVNDRARVLHLTLTLVTALLREASESVGLRPIRAAEHPPVKRPAARPRPLPLPASEPDFGLMARQVKLGYPARLGYDSTTLLRPDSGGTGFLTVEVVRSDQQGYPAAVLAHRAAVESTAG